MAFRRVLVALSLVTLLQLHWAVCAGPGVLRVPKLSTQPLLSENGVQVDLRTGDYSTAALDEQGRAWLVAQYAGERNASAYSPTNDRNRTLNWATWIMQVDPTSP